MAPFLERSRRMVLYGIGGAVAGLAGCTDNDDDGPDLSGPVSDDYETATSQDGVRRDPEELYSKSGVNYQSEPRDDQRCEDCVFYIPDEDGDGLGACAKVEGYVEPEGWCTLYQRYESG